MQKLSEKAYKNKIDYIKRYNSKYRKIFLNFDPIKDKDLLDDLDSSPSKTEFIRTLYKNYKRS